MTGEFDELFIPPRDGNQSWFDKLDDEAREWIAGLARTSVERNQEPNFPAAWDRFFQVFPDRPPVTADTFRKHVRRAITTLKQ